MEKFELGSVCRHQILFRYFIGFSRTCKGGAYTVSLLRVDPVKNMEQNAGRGIFFIIHADHVVQSAWILFSLWMYVCMYVSALERKRLIGMT